jgi:hypothetical protein
MRDRVVRRNNLMIALLNVSKKTADWCGESAFAIETCPDII